MNNFLNKTSDFLKKVTGDKKEWNAMEARAKALPSDYRIVYNEIKQYIWKTSESGSIDIFKGLLDLFEESATNDKRALEVIGDDVATFCDELTGGAKTYIDNWRETMNRNIAQKIKK